MVLKSKKRIVLIASLIVAVVSLVAWGIFALLKPTPPPTPPHHLTKYRTYNSNYTEQEHIQNIKQELKNRLPYVLFEEEIGIENVSNVEILYSFAYDFPEYFIVDFNWTDKNGKAEQGYSIGVIEQDEYYEVHFTFTNAGFEESGTLKKQSPYKGVDGNAKKYYSPYSNGVYAYKQGDNFVFLNSNEPNDKSDVYNNGISETDLIVLGNDRGYYGNPKTYFACVNTTSTATKPPKRNVTLNQYEENLSALKTRVENSILTLPLDNEYQVKDIKNVEILYSFYYDLPEYFIIELQNQSSSEYLLGQIINNEFYLIKNGESYSCSGVTLFNKHGIQSGVKKYYAPYNGHNLSCLFGYLKEKHVRTLTENSDDSTTFITAWEAGNLITSEIKSDYLQL